MDTIATTTRIELWHAAYNTEGKHTIDDLPEGPAVFGLFGIVNEQPVNCRFIDSTENLRAAVQEIYKLPAHAGLSCFIKGAWIPLLQYVLLPGSSPSEREAIRKSWIVQHSPAVGEDGEYPGYYSN